MNNVCEYSIFTKAIDVLKERGWGKGVYQNKIDGTCCLVGACAIAAGLEPQTWENTEDAQILQNIVRNISGMNAVNHNDYKLNHINEAIDILRKAHHVKCELATQTGRSSVQPA